MTQKRTFKTAFIVLKTKKTGESHKSLFVFTPSHGVFWAAAFGALKAKSKLKSYSSSLSYGEGEFYHDPVKNLYRLQSVDQGESFVELAQQLENYLTACLMAEAVTTLIWPPEEGGVIFSLLRDSLFLLKDIESSKREALLVQYLWRLLVNQGFTPDLDSCAKSGLPLNPDKVVYYQKAFDGFCPEDLADFKDLPFNPGMRKYLEHTQGFALQDSLRINLSMDSLKTLRKILTFHLMQITGIKLKTLKMGVGIL